MLPPVKYVIRRIGVFKTDRSQSAGPSLADQDQSWLPKRLKNVPGLKATTRIRLSTRVRGISVLLVLISLAPMGTFLYPPSATAWEVQMHII